VQVHLTILCRRLRPPPNPPFSDLDGTLIDSVYEHVLAWREALREMKIELSTWRIQRRVGMSEPARLLVTRC